MVAVEIPVDFCVHRVWNDVHCVRVGRVIATHTSSCTLLCLPPTIGCGVEEKWSIFGH